MYSSGKANYLFDASDTDFDKAKLLDNKRDARKRSIINQKFLTAISEKNLDEVNSLMNQIDINFKDQDGCTPLHWAVETGDLKIIKTLLKNGVDLNSTNNHHETPIDVAKQINRSDIVKILQESLHLKFKNSSQWDRQSTTSLQDQDVVWINPIHGYIYQLKILMLFLHRGLSCKYSFRLGTEIKEAKKFDDLVFEYVEDNKKVYRLLQAKHKFDESKKITTYKLLTEIKGDYSLVKYFYSFQACKKDKFFKDGIIKDVIICTNIDFDLEDLKNADIEIRKIEEKDDILDMKSTEKEPMRYKFTNSIIGKLKSKLKPTVSHQEIEEFLNHLTFAVNQPNEEELGQIVKAEINREIGCIDTENAYNKLLAKMMDLSLGKESSMFFSHEEGTKFFNDLKDKSSIWFHVQNPVSSFTGRIHCLKKMHKFLIKKFQICVSGMGGVGKTELVRKYISDYGHEYDNQVVWINAESYRSAVDSFHQLASDKLNISLKNSDGQEKNIKSVVSAVYQFFSKGKSLFIFDNAEKYKCGKEFDSGIDQFLPCLPDDCVKPKIIVTSRNQKWPESMKTIVLEALSVEETRELVGNMLALENDEQKELIDELGKKLQFLPLALQQAVAYIKMQKEKLACIELNFEISNYLERYTEMTHELLDFKFSDDSDCNYNKSVFATWNITFDTLKQKENGQDALDILNIVSYLHPDNISIELLLIFSADKEKLSAAIGLLKQYSIVSVQHKAISVHRLVQQVTRLTLQNQNDELNVLKHALSQLQEDHLDYKYIDQVLSIWSFAKKYSKLLEERSRLTTAIIAHLRDCGRIEEGMSIGDEVCTLLAALSKNDENALYYLLSIRNNMAMSKLVKGQYGTALSEFQEIFERQRTILDPSHRKVLATKNNIAYSLMQLGRNHEAIKCFYELIDGYRVNLPENHPNILLAKSSLIGILSAEGKHKEALAMLQEIQEMEGEAIDTFYEKINLARGNIALALANNGKFDESLKIFEKVCIDQEAILPKNHSTILSSKCSIAGILTAQGKHDEAMKILQEVLEIRSELYGQNHPDVMFVNVKIGMVLSDQGEYKKALKTLKDALAKYSATLGAMHPNTLHTEGAVADVFYRQKKYTESIRLYKILLDKQISKFGNDHQETLRTRRSMLRILVDQKRYDEAVTLGLEVFNNAETIYGKDHHDTLHDKKNLAGIYFYMQDFAKALNIFKEVLKTEKVILGKDHIEYQTTKESIAAVKQQIDFALNVSRGNVVHCMIAREDEDGNIGNPTSVNKKDSNGKTALYYAIHDGNESMVQAMLQCGAKIFTTSNDGETPLHAAATKGKVKLVELLLQRSKLERLKEFVDAKTTTSGSTALHVAVKMSHYDIVKFLLKSHATFCALDKDGKTPAGLSSDKKINRLFKVVHEVFDKVKQTDASDVVKKLKNLPLDEFLAAANARNEEGSTLAQVAIKNERKEVASQILQMLQNSKPK